MTSFIIDDIEYKVEINRKRIKNINFRIEDKTIRVSCPFLCTDRYIIDLLKKNEKALIRMAKRSERQESRKEKILYLGNELNFIQFKKIMFDGNTAYGPSVDKVNEYLEKNSLKVFEKRLELYINEFGDIPAFRLRIRKMKTRWGVNNRSSKTITLNTMLIHYKPELIDYVIVHELSHFIHPNHSKNFWLLVSKYYPNYKDIRKYLKDPN